MAAQEPRQEWQPGPLVRPHPVHHSLEHLEAPWQSKKITEKRSSAGSGWELGKALIGTERGGLVLVLLTSSSESLTMRSSQPRTASAISGEALLHEAPLPARRTSAKLEHTNESCASATNRE